MECLEVSGAVRTSWGTSA